MRQDRPSSVDDMTEADIIRFVKSRRYRPMTVDEMAKEFGVADSEFKAFRKFIFEMRVAGYVVEVKRECLADPDKVDCVVGTLLCNPRGFGFIERAIPNSGDDIFVSGSNMSSAMHGDIVVARVPGSVTRKSHRGQQRNRRGASSDVKIVSVVKRARTHVVGTLIESRTVSYIVPDDARIFRDIIVAPTDRNGSRHNDKVMVKVETWPSRHINPTGSVTEVFGPKGQLEAERLSVIHAFSLPSKFSDELLAHAERVPKRVSKAEMGERTNLKDELIITIDPDDARDFDDAVSVKRLENGQWELGVHIADVSHYVKAGDIVDEEAVARCTSVYLPGQVIPMLPEALSNNICSLRPKVYRLTKTVRMTFDKRGKLLKTDCCKSVIKSARRFTYKEVLAVLEGGELPKGEEHLKAKLLEMQTLAQLLRKVRHDQGMLELAIPEARIKTDKAGNTTAIELNFNDDAHRLIEQFMLAANEAVANYLLDNNLPYLCRAHDDPSEKALTQFRESARALGHSIPAPGTKAQLVRFMDRLQGNPEEHVLHFLLLRSMRKAEYAAKVRSHYAIGVAHYLHFTSPIRRYPDLIAHRILDDFWSGRMKEEGVREDYEKEMDSRMAEATRTERNAESAERTIVLRRMKEFLAKETEPLDALIIAAEGYGLRIQTCDALVEGVVRISELLDGFYRVDKQRRALVGPGGRTFQVGDKIKVRVSAFDELKYQIEFVPVREKRQKTKRAKRSGRR
jgi:ribonuclease R